MNFLYDAYDHVVEFKKNMEICIAKYSTTGRIEPTSAYHCSLMLYLLRHGSFYKDRSGSLTCYPQSLFWVRQQFVQTK